MGAQEQGGCNRRTLAHDPRTLCFVLSDVLLMKRGAHARFPNRYNGLGGHISATKTHERRRGF
jgi:hypothetical protein